jgi:pimeloyl-ACP methyl ester carboxylesterase
VSALIIEDELIHYEVLGRGRPVIFLHGWLGSWRYWIPTMQSLSAEYRTYALDLWGFGDSAKISQRYTLEAQAGMVTRFMDQLGILKAAFVGHGLGGAIVLRLATQCPDLADRAMAVSLPLRAAAISPRLLAGPPASLIEWLLGRGPDLDSISREAAKADPQAVETSVRAVMDQEPHTLLAGLRPPCLFVYGERDPMIAAAEDAAFDGLENNLHAIALDVSRHFPMLDEAGKFNRLLADFLALKSGETLTHLGLKEEWRRRIR